MKRVCLLVFIISLAVINVYGLGTKEETLDAYQADKAEMTGRIAELEKEQKELKEEIAKNKKDMEGFARKLASVLPDAGLENLFSGEDVETPKETPPAEVVEVIEEQEIEPVPEEIAELPEEEIIEEEIPSEEILIAETDEVLPEIPQDIILAAGRKGYLTHEAVVDYMTKYSRPPSWFGQKDIETIVAAYFLEAGNERVNPDIALAQLWYATQSLTHYALLSNCNYANLEPINGVEGIGDWDGSFSSIETGVRAHIQHLKGYASSERPANIVDPRYEILVRNDFLGKGDTISKLCAIWTQDTSGRYENTLNEILKSMYQYQFDFVN